MALMEAWGGYESRLGLFGSATDLGSAGCVLCRRCLLPRHITRLRRNRL